MLTNTEWYRVVIPLVVGSGDFARTFVNGNGVNGICGATLENGTMYARIFVLSIQK